MRCNEMQVGCREGKMKRCVSVVCSFSSWASTADETEDGRDRTCERIAYNGVWESRSVNAEVYDRSGVPPTQHSAPPFSLCHDQARTSLRTQKKTV